MQPYVFPSIDPVAFSIGPLLVRWYALAYLTGFILGWQYCLYLARSNPKGPTAQQYDDFLTWAVIGTVMGGRLGYILFYNPEHFFSHPWEMLKIWHGGMSFHGGMLGVLAAALVFTRRRKIGFLAFTDVLACVVPIGLGLGRIANFINGELYGRETSSSFGVLFPDGGDVPRHPSQLYEAFFEGLVLLLLMYLISRRPQWRGRPGLLSGWFLALYGLFRFNLEFFREPDVQLGFLFGGSTMGQLLCLPMMCFGVYLICHSERRTKVRKEKKIKAKK